MSERLMVFTALGVAVLLFMALKRFGRLDPVIHALRRLFPANGRAYELFDSSVFLLLLAVTGYITGTSSAVQRALIFDGFLPKELLGAVLAFGSAAAVVCSYRTRLLDIGYNCAIAVAVLVMALYLISMLFGGFDDRVFISAAVYGWVARRLDREEKRAVCECPHCVHHHPPAEFRVV